MEANETPRFSVRFLCGIGWGALITNLGLCRTGKLNNRRQSFSRVAPIRKSASQPCRLRGTRLWAGGFIHPRISSQRLPVAGSDREASGIPLLYRHRRNGHGLYPNPKGAKDFSETPATILVMWLDSLHINAVDLVDNDSGGLVAQLFLAKYPSRVRTLLLTNCDVDENSLPAQFLPFIEQAKKGTFVDEFIVPQLKDKQFARSRQGMGGLAFTNFEHLADETIETYFRPLLETPLKRSQANEYAVSMATNSLVAICEVLHRWKSPERMVWGLKDVLFSVK
jgi:pimeloyl-ACP methyl ester carboxylesterase